MYHDAWCTGPLMRIMPRPPKQIEYLNADWVSPLPWEFGKNRPEAYVSCSYLGSWLLFKYLTSANVCCGASFFMGPQYAFFFKSQNFGFGLQWALIQLKPLFFSLPNLHWYSSSFLGSPIKFWRLSWGTDGYTQRRSQRLLLPQVSCFSEYLLASLFKCWWLATGKFAHSSVKVRKCECQSATKSMRLPQSVKH